MSFPEHNAYRHSDRQWLGCFPEHWTTRPLWTLFRRVKRTGVEEEQLLSVYREYGVVPKASRDDNFNKPSDDLGLYQLVEPGDLAINKMKAWQGSVAISDFRGIVSPAYFVLKATHNEEPRYLHYLLRSAEFTAGYLSISKGIRPNQWDLEPQEHSRMPVLIPPVSEQTAIATFLDRETGKIDALVEEQERLIELLNEKRQAVISHAVTNGLNPDAPLKASGVEWLGMVPEHWEVRPIRYSIATIESGTSVNAIDTPANEGEYGVLKTSCVYTGTFDPAENKAVVVEEHYRVRCPVSRGAVIVSRMNTPDLVGAAGLVKFDAPDIYLPDRLWQVHFSTGDAAFFHFWMQSLEYRAQVKVACAGTSSSMQNLAQDQFKGFMLAVPPYDEQHEIARFLARQQSRFEDLTNEAESAIQLLQERRSALISAAVTGKIDVTEGTATASEAA